ncbi:Nucleoside phosphorylase [Penicillium expansum]|nr:Nucleoside phosphorylase [Penicillium expansum]
MNRPEQRDPDSADSYTVAWICALEEEYFCACRMLDEEYGGPEISEDNDDNTYVYGRIAKHYVVISCLPAGRYGTNSAARVARDIVRTFPRLRFALMVGIGGGAPTTRNDIRLGDVVKIITNQLLTGFMLQTIHMCSDEIVTNAIHTRWWSARNHRILHVYYRNIASGNSVLKDATIRDTYANDPELNILCFEMEAAGLINNIPCLIIRGICDYCDSHKNDDWHKYAALTAAAYTRELLLVLRPQRVDTLPPWAERVAQELQQVGQELTSLKNTQETVLTTVEYLDQKIDLRKLEGAMEAGFESFSDRDEVQCLQGTRTELLQQIMEWAVSPSQKSIFWLNGMAGTGKSTISRTVAKLLKDTDHLGATFFFKRGEGDRGNAKKFFPILTKQLTLKISELRSSV